jgi:hypothetical protein
LIEFPRLHRDQWREVIIEANAMLAEKFFLYLENLLQNREQADGSPRVVSTSPHVPVKLRERR